MIKIVLSLLLLAPLCSFAGSWRFLGTQDSSATPAANSGFTYYNTDRFVDDVTAQQKTDTTPLNKAQKHQATVWGLTEAQEKRYTQLMHNRSGFYFTQMNPVEVLGINARTNTERQHFAALGAAQFMQRTAKIQAYSKASAVAQAALVKKLKLPRLRWTSADSEAFSPLNFAAIHLQKNDTVFFFLRSTDSVNAIMASLLPAVLANPTVHLNIYFADKPTTSTVSTWAHRQGIPPALVTTTLRITLNTEGAPLLALKKGTRLPAIYIARGGRSVPVDIGQF